MSKHNDREFTAKMQAMFREGYEKTFRDGITRGAYAVCRVVMDKIKDAEKSETEKLQAIEQFCSSFTKLHDSVKADGADQNKQRSEGDARHEV